MTSEERPFHAAAAWVWAFLTLVWWFASFALALPLATFGPEFGAGLRWDLAVVVAVNGAASLVGVWVLGRALVRRPLRRPGLGLVVPIMGVALAIAEELALHAWATARFGYYDSELIWWTAGLSPMLMLTAVASFGVLVAPRGAVAPPFIGLVAAAAIVCLVVLSNVAGLADGIEPASWPLAISVGLAAVYAVACVGVALRRTVA